MAGEVGPWGGDGGEPFSLDNITSIVKICVASDKYINAITVTYIVDGVEKSIKWGGGGGKPEEFILQPDEYITSVKGYYGETSDDDWCGVRALIFETRNNNETSTYGPYGNEVGTEFVKFEVIGEIRGFHGRLAGLGAGIGIHALGFYIKITLCFLTSDGEDDDDEKIDWTALCMSLLELEPSIRDPRDEGTSDSWVERNPSLIHFTDKHPFNSEPPLARLMHHGFITPVQLHYVRNHGYVPQANWATWTVEVTDLVKDPVHITMDQLVNDFKLIETR